MLKFNLVVEIDEESLAEVLEMNPDVTIDQLKSELNNACYLGLGCIESLVLRQTGVEVNDTYIKSAPNKPWGEAWGDNFPTENECPIDVIEHHAKSYDFPVSDDIISFARAMWNEGNLTEKLS